MNENSWILLSSVYLYMFFLFFLGLFFKSFCLKVKNSYKILIFKILL